MGILFQIYLLIGFFLTLYVEYILDNVPKDIIDIFAQDLDINSFTTHFAIMLVCVFGWPFILMKMFNR